MASICKEFNVGADPATAWDALRDFGAVHTRVAAGFVTNTAPHGNDRVVTFANGAVARERLVAAVDERRRLVYCVVESPFALTHHQATVEVTDANDGGSRLVWITDVLPDEAAAPIDAMMTAGAAAIAATLAR